MRGFFSRISIPQTPAGCVFRLICFFVLATFVSAIINLIIVCLAYVGITPLFVLDYLGRPLTWLGIFSPDQAWFVIGFIVGAPLGLIVYAVRSGHRNAVQKIVIAYLLLLFALITLSVLANSILPKPNLIGTWKGDYDGVNSELEIDRQQDESFSGVLSYGETKTKIRIGVIGAIKPGTNLIQVRETNLLSKPASYLKWKPVISQARLSVTLNSLWGVGQNSEGNLTQWKFERKSDKRLSTPEPETNEKKIW
ncbi:MAG: hypothetical protein LW832_07045 [Parachlamydia sp.]|jgi:hypothetical protein|nr:hypothetical protein [Parachlamydia sp.]